MNERDGEGGGRERGTTAAATWAVADGAIEIFRLFDLGDEIDLVRAERLLASPSSRPKLDAVRSATALEIPRPPLEVALGRRTLPLASGARDAQASARLFDYGVASVRYELAIPPGTELRDLVPLAEELVARATPALDLAARAEAEALGRAVAGAVQAPHAWEGLETYQVFLVRRFARRATAREVLQDAPVAELLLGETSGTPLSSAERADVLRHAHSYLEDDLAVVDWNSAFVLEPSGTGDIADLLEFATAHLLELRYYDALLDRELASIYDELGARPARSRLFTRRHSRLLRRTAALLLDLSETVERLENAVKIVGDFYLARLYQGAVERFRLPAWQASVLRKQKLLAGVHELLNDASDTRRAELLEVTIIVLILWEIVFALLRR